MPGEVLRVLGATLQEAELARDELAMKLQDYGDVTGVGIVRLGDGYGVRVSLREPESEVQGVLTPDFHGVPIKIRFTGRVVAHHAR
jgi:hypothetical protein